MTPEQHRGTLYVMVGLPASGKTTKAREIEQNVGALRLTPDEWMLPLFGLPEDVNDPMGWLAEWQDRRAVLEGRFIWLANRALPLGISVILDFGVWSRAERSALRALAADLGADFALIYMEIDEQTQSVHRSLREATDRVSTVPMSDHLLDLFASQFEAPGAEELSSGAPHPPPQGFATWADWIAQRWPTARDR